MDVTIDALQKAIQRVNQHSRGRTAVNSCTSYDIDNTLIMRSTIIKGDEIESTFFQIVRIYIYINYILILLDYM